MRGNVGQRLADEVAYRLKAHLLHILKETLVHRLDALVAVLHDRGTDLQRGRAREDELYRILPCVYAADTGDRDVDGLGDLSDGAQSDGLYRAAAHAGKCALAVDRGIRDEIIDVDSGNGIEGVYRCYGVCAGFLSRASLAADVGNHCGELWHNREIGFGSDPVGDHLYSLLVAADLSAAARFRHTVGA